MSDELKQIAEEFQATWHEFKQRADERDAEVKRLGEASAETAQTIERLQDTLDKLEARLEKASLDTKPGGRSERSETFLSWCRKGQLGPDELKVLTVSDDTTGGIIAPDEFVAELLKGVIEYSPIRELATVRTTTFGSVKAPKRTGTFAAQWVSEQGTRSETTGYSLGQEEIPTHELYALVDVSNVDLEDTALDLEGLLRDEFSEQFGVAEATAFVNGNGVGKPWGILQDSSIQTVTSLTANALDGRDFAQVFYQLKEPYQGQATWLLNRLTVRDARNLRDTTNNFIWQPSLGSDTPATILGRPYRMASDFPTVATGAKAIAVGAFKRAYWVVDRVALAVQRDPFTQATTGNVRFIARRRVGGQVVVPEAIKILTIQ
jgi:HK97 family phage major capsid protein